jgi:glutamine synthetase
VLTPDHGYSLLRTTNNKDYFYALYNEAAKFGIEIEGHRVY